MGEMKVFTVVQLTGERGEVQTIVEKKSLLHVILSTKKKLRFVFALVLGVIALMTLISMAVVLRKPGEHEKSEKVENLKYILPVSAVSAVPHDLTSTKKRIIRATPESGYEILIAKISNVIGEIELQKKQKVTDKGRYRKSLTKPLVSENVRNRKSISGSVVSSIRARQCSKAKCKFNDLCMEILVSDVNPGEIKRKMKQFDVRVDLETFKTKPNLPDFNEENIDTLVKYQLIFQQFTQHLKLVHSNENDTIANFGIHIEDLTQKIKHAKNRLQMDCGKIPNKYLQNIVYLQGYEDLIIKVYNKEEILYILFNQIEEIFLSLKKDFYKRQICLGDIQCSS